MAVTQPRTAAPFPVRLTGVRRARGILLAAGLALVLGVALALRLYGLDWDEGYSHTPHPDERAILMHVAELSPPSLGQLPLLLDADESPWNPRWFPYGSFPLYLLKGAQLVLSAVGGAEISDLRVLGRTLSALADAATVLVVYLLGNRMFGRREGLLASALVALAVIHIQLSHFFAVDTIQSLLAVAALYFIYRVARLGKLRDSILAGALVGLGVATKFSQLPMYIAFAAAHLLYLMSPEEGPARRGLQSRLRASILGLGAGSGASLVVLLVAQPYAFLDWGRYFGDVIEQSEMVRRVRDYPYTRQYVDTTPYWYHVQQLSTWGLGWPLGIITWGGLVYAALRGMRLGYGLIYLGVGLVLPAALLLYSASFLAIVVASGIAFVALMATAPLRSAATRPTVLLLAWVVPYLLITGAFEVKFIRYMVPVTPILVLLGSRMLLDLWDATSRHRASLRPVLAVVIGALVVATGAYAFSYIAIYGSPHTAVRTAQWINSKAPVGSVILKEHWEEGIPDMARYTVRELPMYEDDRPAKLNLVSRELARADYIVFYSNRLYGTIPRLPERYPLSTEYYRLLFSGALGYELVNVEAAYPRLAGLNLADDTFSRPGVPSPDTFDSQASLGPAVNLGFADESFSVYDHPLVLVFENVQDHSAETISQAILEAPPPNDIGLGSKELGGGLLLSPEQAQSQRGGGGWAEIVRSDGWTSRYPVLAWLLVVQGFALLALPMTLALFKPLADRGYLFSKALGLLAVALVVWLLASLEWMAFSRGSILVAVLFVGAGSTSVLAKTRLDTLQFLRERWRLLLTAEALFLGAFLAFVLVRMANPDLWDPHLGGEKPMDHAYLNAVLRSSYMPPYDPWFAGGYLNYYYWGQFLVATLIRATGIDPAVAFNLAVPLFFALTVAGAFTVVYNLAEGTRRSRATLAGAESEGDPEGRQVRSGRIWMASPVLAGLAGALFVAVLGNLDGAVQVGQGAWRALVQDLPFGQFDFWRSSRMMPPGIEITEFPFFTFLFADLHAHLMALPYTLLALGLAVALVAGATGGQGKGHTPDAWSLAELARLAALGVVVGSLRLINTWDFPTYLILAVAAVFLAEYSRNGGLALMVVARWVAKAALVGAVGYIVFLPYHLNYEAFFTSIEATTNQTVLWQFLGITGLFVFIIMSHYVWEWKGWLLPQWRAVRGWALGLASSPPERNGGPIAEGERRRVRRLRLSAMALAVVVAVYILSVTVAGWAGSTIPFLVILAVLALLSGIKALASHRADAPYLALVAVMVLVALSLAGGLDIWRVEGDIDRMNSVFKFYLQVWVLLALAAAYLLWRLAHQRRQPLLRLAPWRKLWVGALVILIAGASIYPYMGAQVRLRTRFEVHPPTLDGMRYMRDAVYQDANGPIDLAADYDAIRWLQGSTNGSANVVGSPVILEGLTPLYRWGSRVSVYTGLPSVLGWDWHQKQQRWGYQGEVRQRQVDVKSMYTTADASEALTLMRKYAVEYVYVGQLERLYYPEAGIAKFDEGLSPPLQKVYENGQVVIYRLVEG